MQATCSLSSEYNLLAKQWLEFVGNLKWYSRKEIPKESRFFLLKSQELKIKQLEFSVNHNIPAWLENGTRSINIGGPMGSGKSIIAQALNQKLGWKFIDSDTFHPKQNIEKMRAGIALCNDDRKPFMQGIANFLSGEQTISSCPALMSSLRAIIAGQGIERITETDSQQLWDISNPSPMAPLQFIIYKPYELALTELDASTKGITAKRYLNGEPHFIQVTRESESEAQANGKTGILKNQYDLLGNPELIMPWEAIVINAQEFISTEGSYNTAGMVEKLLKYIKSA